MTGKLTKALGLAALVAAAGCATGNGGGGKTYPLGKCMWGLGEAADLKAAGYDFCENSVSAFLIPDKDDAAWAEQKEKILAENKILKTVSCNGFLPGTFRLTGPEPTHEAALEYAMRACRRADEVGLDYIVFGSGAARKIPDGFDHAEGRRQFVDFCRKLAAAMEAAGCRVTIVLEPLNWKETNLLNYVREGAEIVDEIGSDRIRLLADLYHMCAGGEKAEALVAAGRRLRHVHVADPTRQYPGFSSADLSPYFRALDAAGYSDGVSIESGWPGGDDYAKARLVARDTVRGWMKGAR